MKLSSLQDENVCLDPQDFTWDIFTRKSLYLLVLSIPAGDELHLVHFHSQ